jgi:hypothetical protein
LEGQASGVIDGANSTWSIELSGTSADLLAVTGDIHLSAVDSLNVTGAGTGSSWLIGTYTGVETGAFDTDRPARSGTELQRDRTEFSNRNPSPSRILLCQLELQ